MILQLERQSNMDIYLLKNWPLMALTSFVLVSLATNACAFEGQSATARAAQEIPALHEAFKDDFLIGAALNPGQFSERDARSTALVMKHFNTITPENVMKWERIHPEPDVYNFEPADRFVAFGEENDMFIVGHTLIWHSQVPDWVFEDEQGEPLTRDALIDRMRDHIYTVAGRYEGRVHGWDVVNEALNEDGSLRETRWLEVIGEEYLALAFRFAHEADPNAKLYYNDYSLENPEKRAGAVRLVQNLQEQGVPIHGIGTQSHHTLDYPPLEQIEVTILELGELGIDVMVTELDVAVLPRGMDHAGADVDRSAELRDELNPYSDGLPDSVQQELAQHYADIFAIYNRHRDVLARVTFWGVTDGDTWLNNWPIRGRTAHPLLFDREFQPKPAFYAIIDTTR